MIPPLALLGAPALYAMWNVYAALRARAAMTRVPREAPLRAAWPRLSLIVPACNEGDTIEAATKAKLASDYPNLEVILVDDRSTDATTEIFARLAAADERVRVVRIDELPTGWLGKVHAMHRGVASATGEWLLFSDADVHIEATLLRRTIAITEERRLDFASMMPRLWSSGFAVDVVIAFLVRGLVVFSRIWKVADPRSRVAIGNGVFGLVQRSAFEKTPGFAWLRLEILDDQALGQMMKHSGARCGVFDAQGDLALHFYPSLGEMMRGLEKNGYVLVGQLRPHRLIFTSIALVYLELGPAVALAFPSTRVAGAILLATLAALQLALARSGRRPLLPALVPVFGPVLLLVFILRSAILAHARGGISWRGTFYSLASLRAGQRFELF
jgi:glycosyltransferase involved in cell wall biosynthesis